MKNEYSKSKDEKNMERNWKFETLLLKSLIPHTHSYQLTQSSIKQTCYTAKKLNELNPSAIFYLLILFQSTKIKKKNCIRPCVALILDIFYNINEILNPKRNFALSLSIKKTHTFTRRLE